MCKHAQGVCVHIRAQKRPAVPSGKGTNNICRATNSIFPLVLKHTAIRGRKDERTEGREIDGEREREWDPWTVLKIHLCSRCFLCFLSHSSKQHAPQLCQYLCVGVKGKTHCGASWRLKGKKQPLGEIQYLRLLAVLLVWWFISLWRRSDKFWASWNHAALPYFLKFYFLLSNNHRAKDLFWPMILLGIRVVNIKHWINFISYIIQYVCCHKLPSWRRRRRSWR